ncbi:antiterminator LoaP [Ruminiclostridium cellulolyticum]|uniref:antiterminator LoaP n=1 Tax=Ruminiclostridium cellulolyticum TaxID=1521 RepID=UPI0000E9845A|nr:antiterminator LoaP [Ruminiclostridium cellulolyticum]
MHWYVLFVKSGREHRVEQYLKKIVGIDMINPFIPLHEFLFKISGTVKRELKPLFPGYVFIESDMAGQEFIRKLYNKIYLLSDIVRILKYSDTEIAVRDSEKQMLLDLCNNEHCIESSRGVIKGDRIYITNGPLRGRESIIKKVNRHKRQALVEMEFMGDKRLVSVALEIVEKVV